MNHEISPKIKSRQFFIVTLLILVILLAACTPDTNQSTEEVTQETAAEQVVEEPTSEPVEEPEEPVSPYAVDRFEAAILGDESTLNPFTYVTGDPGWNILMFQYDSLFTLGLDGEPTPWLVTDWDLSDDGLNYTLHLREDVVWNDGEVFTANDVLFTFDYLTTYPVGRFARSIRGFESAQVLDDYTIVITLSNANPSYPRSSFADVPIMPEHVWKDVTDPQNHQFDSVTNVGTGPFKLMEYSPDQFYRFEANEDYFAGLPVVRELVLIKFADEAGAQAAFRTNEVDMIFRPIPPEQINLLGQVEGVTIAQGPQFTTQMLIFNYDQAPFEMAEVRQAIAYAIDRQDLVDTLYFGAATAGSNGWIHPDSPFFNAQVSTEYDLAIANELLDSVEIVDSDGDGVREYNGQPMAFELITPNSNALRLRSAELIKSMLVDIGIEVTVASVEQTTWEEAVWPGFDIANGRNYQMSMWGWSAPVQADTFRAPELFHSNPGIGFLNLSGTANEEIDRISNEMALERDPARRAELLDELQVAIADEMPFVVLVYPDGVYAYWSTVYDNMAFIVGQGVVNKLTFLPEDVRP